MIVYFIRNIINNKIYIGQTIRSLKDRINSYKYEANAFARGIKSANRPIIWAIAKYGLDNFIFSIIDYASSQKELDDKEKYWILYHKSYDRNIGYNLDLSRVGRGKVSEETKIKMSESNSGENHPFYGKIHSNESLYKMKQSHFGKEILKETKEKISTALSGSNNGNSKLSIEEVILIRKERQEGKSIKDLALKYKVSLRCISHIVNFKTYRF